MTELTSKSIENQLEQNRKLIQKLDDIIKGLDAGNAESLNLISLNNFDTDAQNKLKLLERELLKNRERRREAEKQAEDIVQKYRLIQQAEDLASYNTIQDKMLHVSEERDRLRTEIIPSLERLLEDLNQRKQELDTIVLSLSKELNRASRLREQDNLDTEL
jgi:hypothetical protein